MSRYQSDHHTDIPVRYSCSMCEKSYASRSKLIGTSWTDETRWRHFRSERMMYLYLLSMTDSLFRCLVLCYAFWLIIIRVVITTRVGTYVTPTCTQLRFIQCVSVLGWSARVHYHFGRLSNLLFSLVAFIYVVASLLWMCHSCVHSFSDYRSWLKVIKL